MLNDICLAFYHIAAPEVLIQNKIKRHNNNNLNSIKAGIFSPISLVPKTTPGMKEEFRTYLMKD